MQCKRCRVGDIGSAADNMEHQSVQKIVLVSPSAPEKETEHFLESCNRCKRRLNPNQDVYMYGYLGAFCSPQCRNVQIAIDKAREQVRDQSIGTGSSSSSRRNKLSWKGTQRNHGLYLTS